MVSLTLSNDCDTIILTEDITICEPLVADFVWSRMDSTQLTVAFTDSSQTANGWFWDFGDGNTSTLQNPSHTYAASGTYTVILYVSNECGAGDSIQYKLTNWITDIEENQVNFPIRAYPNPATSHIWIEGMTDFSLPLQISLVALDSKIIPIQHLDQVPPEPLRLQLPECTNGIYQLRIQTPHHQYQSLIGINK